MNETNKDFDIISVLPKKYPSNKNSYSFSKKYCCCKCWRLFQLDKISETLAKVDHIANDFDERIKLSIKFKLKFKNKKIYKYKSSRLNYHIILLFDLIQFI